MVMPLSSCGCPYWVWSEALFVGGIPMSAWIGSWGPRWSLGVVIEGCGDAALMLWYVVEGSSFCRLFTIELELSRWNGLG